MSLLRHLYYEFKPFLPLRLRMAFRRRLAARTLARSRDVWPINPLTGRAPEGWSGWPNGKAFAFILTHDVESAVGLERCLQLADLEESLGFRSSFNFIPEGEYTTPNALRHKLMDRGFEIGVHDLHHDGKLYSSRRDFQRRAGKINNYLREWNAVGFRSGFMHHELDWLHDLDIAYDMSTFDTDPFEPQPDAADTIFPFWVPRGTLDPSASNGAGYVELPYTLPQDSTLFFLLEEEGIEVWKQKLDWIAENGGMALLNVHPDYISFNGANGFSEYPVDHYADLLNYVRNRYDGKCWLSTPKEVAQWSRHATQGPELREGITLLSKQSEKSRNDLPKYNIAKLTGSAQSSEFLAGKRIAVVVFSYYPNDPRVRRETEALCENGAVVDLFCLKGESEVAEELVNGVHVHRLPLSRKRGGKLRYFIQYGTFIFLSFWQLLVRSLKNRYLIVHVHNMPDVLVFSALIPKLRGAKVILDLHDPTPEVYMTIYNLPLEARMIRALVSLERWSIDFSDLAITPNIAFKELFVERGSPDQKMVIVMNSPQTEVFERAKKAAPIIPQSSTGEFVLMFHGSLLERHGIDDLIHAVQFLRKEIPPIRLHIYGSRTPYVETIEQLISKLHLQEHVFYHGQRTLEEIAQLICGANLGIIPNKRTPFTEINMPTRIFEYLEMGKPVIAPRTKGIQDYFAESEIIYFEPGDISDLAARIMWVYQNDSEAEKIMARGQNVYLRYRWETQKASFVAGVKSMVAGQSFS